MSKRAARVVDVVAVLIVLVAVLRFAVLPRLHAATPATAPPVALGTLGGGRFDLSKQRGKVVILDFFATWCGPCRDSIPHIQAFRRAHPEIVVESVDSGEDPHVVPAFASQFHMDDVAFDEDQTVSHAFAVSGLPTIIAVDGNGRVRNRWDGDDPQIEADLAVAVAGYRS